MNDQKVSVIWIDDDERHQTDADILQEKIKEFSENVTVSFCHPEVFRKEIEEKVDVDLFLVDDKLNQYSFRGERYRGRGLSCIGLIRENHPDVPVYLFSAEPESKIYKDLAYVSEREAELKLKYNEIQDRGHIILYNDALDYRKVRNTISEGLERLINLLSPPDVEKERIRGLLPHILKTNQFEGVKAETIAGRSIDFASWVRKILMKKPGFLYDILYSATSIGMTEEAFGKRIEVFKPALYRGIFSVTSTEELWWKTALYNIVVKRANEKRKKENREEAPSDVRKLSVYAFDLREREIAKCVVCKGEFPDTIGIRIHSDLKEPVHYRCSYENPEDTKILFFDELRIIEDEKR